MAAAVLRRGEAIVWLPPRVAGERSLAGESSLLVAAGPSRDRPVMARASLETLPPMRSVRLIVDARDVTLLRARLPALPAARLQRALPNLLEDQILQDPQTCAWALGGSEGGAERLVAAVDRHWLDVVTQAFERRGIRVTAVWPAQALQLKQPDSVAVLLCVGSSIAVLPAVGDGVGLAAGTELHTRREALRSALALLAAAGGGEVLGLTEDDGWRAVLRESAAEAGVALRLGELPTPGAASVDLLAAQRSGALARWASAFDWRAWRWPLAGALTCAALAVAGLNLHWYALAREQAELLATLDRSFAQVFPAGTTRVDPVLQMQRHVAQLRARAGQASPDDFLPLVVGLSLALGTQAQDAIGSLEYRDGRLRARFRPGIADTRAARDALELAGRRQGLRLRFDSEREPLATITVLR
ncbi:MAG: type II secretion system protein GspL [Burkholderiaceae bacterium]|jgi:general secretion pathway protein L